MATGTEWAEWAELNAGREGQPMVALDRTTQRNTIVLSSSSYIILEELTCKIVSRRWMYHVDDELVLPRSAIEVLVNSYKENN